MLGLPHWEPGLQEGLWGAAPPRGGLSGRPGPSSHLWGQAGGSSPGPRTKRLSNFLASVMWTQLSFSTTLMCFTSSLNLGQAHRRGGHCRPRGPSPAGLRAHCACAGAKTWAPGPHLLLVAAPSRPSPPPQPGPASDCLPIHPPGHLVCLKPKLPGQPRPRAPEPHTRPPRSPVETSIPDAACCLHWGRPPPRDPLPACPRPSPEASADLSL